MTDQLPCDSKGWGWPAAHCAPPVGDREDGHACLGCALRGDDNGGEQ